MKKPILMPVTLVFALLMGAAHAETGLVKKLSARSVQQTMDSLEKLVQKKGLTVFARIDHAAGAAKAGKALPPTQLLIFGNPRMGSELMAKRPSVGIDLPMKVLVWEDSDGKVWMVYNDPRYLAERHGIRDGEAILSGMSGTLRGLVSAAGSP